MSQIDPKPKFTASAGRLKSGRGHLACHSMQLHPRLGAPRDHARQRRADERSWWSPKWRFKTAQLVGYDLLSEASTSHLVRFVDVAHL